MAEWVEKSRDKDDRVIIMAEMEDGTETGRFQYRFSDRTMLVQPPNELTYTQLPPQSGDNSIGAATAAFAGAISGAIVAVTLFIVQAIL